MRFILIFTFFVTFFFLFLYYFDTQQVLGVNLSKNTAASTSSQLSPPPATPSPTPIPIPLPALSTNLLTPGQHSFSFNTSDGREVRYLLYIPKQFKTDKKWPLLMFMHGGGQLGNNPDSLKISYLPELLETQQDLPLVIVSPIISSGEWVDYVDQLDELVIELTKIIPLDKHRFYLTGLSMGGIGSWKYALKYPNRFAAIVPVAGGYNSINDQIPQDLCKLQKIGVWVFNGDSDQGQIPFHSQELVIKLNSCGGKAKFTLFSNSNHEDTWHKAYNDPALWKWLLINSN